MLHVRHLPIAKTCRHAFLLLSNMLNWDWDDYCPNYCRFGIWLVARRPIPTYVQRNLTRTSSTMILELHMSRCSCTQNITWEYLFQLRCFFFCLTLAVWYLSHLSIYQFIYLSTNLPIHFPTYVQNRCTYLFTIFEQWKLCKQKWFKISHKPTICPPCPKSVGFQPCGTQRLRHQKKTNNTKQPWILREAPRLHPSVPWAQKNYQRSRSPEIEPQKSRWSCDGRGPCRQALDFGRLFLIHYQPKECMFFSGNNLKINHTFALFDFPKIGSSMTPVISNYLRQLEHTSGKKLSVNCLCSKSFHICILGYLGYVPGICWSFLKKKGYKLYITTPLI